MKKIIYLFTVLLTVFAINSCDRMEDHDGNLLNDLDANQLGITGDRFLYQEESSIDTLAQYQYNGRKLVGVITPEGVTTIVYSGELINKISYVGIESGTEIKYTQLFTYDQTGKKIVTITENRTEQDNILNTTPDPIETFKTIYNVTYAGSSTNKLETVIGMTGQVIPLTTFAYTSYEKATFTYDAKANVSKVVKDYGGVVGGVPGASVQEDTYTFSNYDQMKNPYFNLLPFSYIVSNTLTDPIRSYWFSKNNPKDISLSNISLPIPITYSTTYTYDPQSYPLSGFGTNYDYRPF